MAEVAKETKNPFEEELRATAKIIATRGKGILAADEREANIGGKLEKIGMENNKENRVKYRELLFTTKGWGEYCSGVILNEEILFSDASDGEALVDKIKQENVCIGIKCDRGTRDRPFFPGESTTQGITDLDVRAPKYYERGARFAKWRNVLKIVDGKVSETAIQDAAMTLAKYALICQRNGLCPIVEPEVLLDGDHDISVCQYWTQKAITATYKAMSDFGVILEGSLLKPNMVLNGKQFDGSRDIKVNAAKTIEALKRAVPVAVPAIAFLSGGQSEEEATLNLNEINKQELPWTCTFSYGRALQGTCLATWEGKEDNVAAAQAAFLKRAKCNAEAQLGKYDGWGASEDSKKSLFQKGYKY